MDRVGRTISRHDVPFSETIVNGRWTWPETMDSSIETVHDYDDVHSAVPRLAKVVADLQLENAAIRAELEGLKVWKAA